MQAELSSIAKLSVAALNLFYDPFECLLREVVRRMKRKDYHRDEPGGEYVMGLHKRLLQRGQQGPGASDRYLQAFLNLDVDRLAVMRAIGAGSEAARLVAMDRLMTMFGSLPEFGKQNRSGYDRQDTGLWEARYCVPPVRTGRLRWTPRLPSSKNARFWRRADRSRRAEQFRPRSI
jgi:hypothetical protein